MGGYYTKNRRLFATGATSYLCKVNAMEALARDHEPRAVAAIASRFNRVEPSHGQEAFASASTASPQLACRLAATPGHESGLTPDTNRHEKLGVSTQGAGARSWRAELFSFPVPHSCSLRGRRIRGRASFACREAIRLPDERSEEPCEARSQEAERKFVGTYGTVYVESKRCRHAELSCIKVSAHPFATYRHHLCNIIHAEMVKYSHVDGGANKDLTKDLQGTAQ